MTTYYLYDGFTLIAELDSGGNLVRSYTWGADGLISDRSGSSSRFHLFDAVGNTRSLLDSSGAVLGLADYGAWGRVVGSGSLSTPFAWQGQIEEKRSAEFAGAGGSADDRINEGGAQS